MIWLIGVGNMGIEYAKVLDALDENSIAIGRSEKSSKIFEEKSSNKTVTGGLTRFLTTNPPLPSAAIVAVNVELLASITEELLVYGVKNILVEKPGFGLLSEIGSLVDKSQGANVVLAYNRRFYSSVLAAEKIIKEDGGVSSFNFEFTEWTHTFDVANMNPITLSTWLMANSSHVIDTAFFLGGQPVELSAYFNGSLVWHPSSANFVGAGITDKGALFNYSANWEAPGRWVVEILTKKHRLYLKPMESLQIQNIGSITISPVEIDNSLDIGFKPGLYLQTKAFLAGDFSRFCTIEEQKEHIEKYYAKMSGYTK